MHVSKIAWVDGRLETSTGAALPKWEEETSTPSRPWLIIAMCEYYWRPGTAHLGYCPLSLLFFTSASDHRARTPHKEKKLRLGNFLTHTLGLQQIRSPHARSPRLYLATRLSRKASSRCGLVRHLVRPFISHGSHGSLAGSRHGPQLSSARA